VSAEADGVAAAAGLGGDGGGLMGWQERMTREALEASKGPAGPASTEPRPDMAGMRPSPWLEERMREFGAQLIGASNAVAKILDPPRVVGPGQAAGQPQVDPVKAILMNQMIILRGLAVVNDCLLIVTTGRGVLKPIEAQGAPAPHPNGGGGEEKG
jgi:hypothetical protein